jgi:hypothetical protein
MARTKHSINFRFAPASGTTEYRQAASRPTLDAIMETATEKYSSFDILIRKKIPYWSALLMGLMFACFVFLMLLYLFMYPSNGSSREMQVAYYILVVPEWLKELSAYSFLGFILLIPIYSISKSYKPGMVSFKENIIEIQGQSTRQLSLESVKKVFVNDVKRWFTTPSEAIEVVIKQTGDRRTSFLLKHYEEAEAFIESLSRLENVEFVFYNEFSMNTHDDD